MDISELELVFPHTWVPLGLSPPILGSMLSFELKHLDY